MSRVGLKQVIGRSADARALVAAIADALGSPVAVEDDDGRLLHGEAPPTAAPTRLPVTHGDASLGWVSGPEQARAVAVLLDHLVAREVERKALGAEVLHLYREINLIYSFSEKLAALLELERVAELTLQQARQMIVATDGVIMLLDEETGVLTTVAGVRRRDAGARRASGGATGSSARSPPPASRRSSTTWTATRGASPSTRR